MKAASCVSPLKAFAGIALAGGLVLSVFVGPVRAENAASSNLEIADAWSKEVAPGSSIRRAFFSVRNHGAVDDRLLAVSSPIAETAEIHGGGQAALWHEMAEKDVVARPRKGGVAIPAHSETEFRPGGYYVMFVELKTVTPKGETFAATLTFEKAGEIEVDFLVDARPIAASQR